MPAKSKAQQRFFGMVRAAQKGEGASSPEVAKVADEISNKDAKKFAKTKHKGLPEKKKVDESTKHVVDGEKYLKLPKKYKKLAKNKGDYRSALGKAKDAITDKLGKTNTDRDGVKDSSNRVFTMQNSYEPEGKVVEGYKGTADLSKADPAAKKKVEDRIAKHVGTKRVPGGKKGYVQEGDVPRGPGGNPIRIKDKIKAAKGFIPHKGKPTVEMKESVLDLVRKYGKKKKEKQPQKAMDAGARAKRKLARREYRSKVGATVPSELEDQKSWLDFTGHFHI